MTKLLALSSVYETEPMYLEDQGWFLNCVAVVETDLEPASLLGLLREIEGSMGRKDRRAKNEPRAIDLDLLLYGERVISGPTLEVPHPGLAERAFVLVPLNEVRPRLVHPALGKSVAELLKDLQTEKRVVKRPGLLADLSPSPPRQPAQPGPSPARRGS